MEILLHVGLNKCASSYIQAALCRAQARLRQAGVFYGVEGRHQAHYGVSRYYGFGPDEAGVTPRSLPWLAREAERRRCPRMIVSSEYLSLARPEAIGRLVGDAEGLGARLRVLFFSREAEPWIASLFNQYVKMGGDCSGIAGINGFVDRVLRNGTVDIARRWRAWVEAAGADRVTHHRLLPEAPPEAVLAPFSAFAGISLPPPSPRAANASLSPGALWLTALLRKLPATPERDRLIAALAGRELAWVPVPRDFLALDAARRARIRSEIEEPRLALPHSPLPVAEPV